MRSDCTLPRSTSKGLLTVALGAALAACAPELPDPGVDTREPVESGEEAVGNGSVDHAAKYACSTATVKGLSLQIIAESSCIDPDAFTAVPSRPNLRVEGDHVFLYLERPARDRLVAALDANPQKTMTVNSALRTVAQQYLLKRWDIAGRCGISVAASPGLSNHQTGLALDIEEYSGWKGSLSARGFAWFGNSDRWHFDYVGQGAIDHRGLDVLAFQRLWNRNNPNDRITEDGDYGPGTESRLKKSPAKGFPIGASCAAPTDASPSCNAVFVDICATPHRADIEWLAAEDITQGCNPTAKLYCPDRKLTRGELASLLTKSLGLSTGPDAFSDDDGHPHEAAINAIAAAGISAGCGAGRFCPDRVVVRAELAAMFTVAFQLPPGPEAFDDDDGSLHEAAINAVAAAGITSGCAPKQFCPNVAVQRDQVASMLRRALE